MCMWFLTNVLIPGTLGVIIGAAVGFTAARRLYRR